jgi:hypothetical protein
MLLIYLNFTLTAYAVQTEIVIQQLGRGNRHDNPNPTARAQTAKERKPRTTAAIASWVAA